MPQRRERPVPGFCDRGRLRTTIAVPLGRGLQVPKITDRGVAYVRNAVSAVIAKATGLLLLSCSGKDRPARHVAESEFQKQLQMQLINAMPGDC